MENADHIDFLYIPTCNVNNDIIRILVAHVLFVVLQRIHDNSDLQ